MPSCNVFALTSFTFSLHFILAREVLDGSAPQPLCWRNLAFFTWNRTTSWCLVMSLVVIRIMHEINSKSYYMMSMCIGTVQKPMIIWTWYQRCAEGLGIISGACKNWLRHLSHLHDCQWDIFAGCALSVQKTASH